MKNYCPFSAVALILCITAFSATSQDTSLLSHVVKNYSGDISLSASFDLKIFWKIREKEETRHGKIVLAPHDRFRIGLGESVWVSDGTTMWQYDKLPSPQVIIRRLSSCDPSQLPSRLLSKYIARYAFKQRETKGKNAVFAWTPTRDSSAVSPEGDAAAITLTVDTKTEIVQELAVIDKSGNTSTYAFHGTAFGAPPPASFSFDIPKGVRVLDERQ